MHSEQLEQFLSTLPEPDLFAGKNLYVWGIGGTTLYLQEGFAREKSLNICGYTVSKGYEVSNYTHGGANLRKEFTHS